MMHFQSSILVPAAWINCARRIQFIQMRPVLVYRVREVERVSFTPLVLSLTGGLGNAASVCYKRLASLISAKRYVPYSSTMAWIRCSLSFSLLRSSVQCILGGSSTIGHANNQSLLWTLFPPKQGFPLANFE